MLKNELNRALRQELQQRIHRQASDGLLARGAGADAHKDHAFAAVLEGGSGRHARDLVHHLVALCILAVLEAEQPRLFELRLDLVHAQLVAKARQALDVGGARHDGRLGRCELRLRLRPWLRLSPLFREP